MPAPPLDGPRLAGDRTLWVDGPYLGQGYRLWSQGVGARTLLRTESASAPGAALVPRIAASSELTALTVARIETGAELRYPHPAGPSPWSAPEDVLLAGSGADFERISACQRRDEFPSQIDVDGATAVYRVCGVVDGIEIRDFATGFTRSIAGARAPRIAGRYVAWLTGAQPPSQLENHSDVVVYDRKADAVAYTVPASAFPYVIRSLDIQDDGTAVVAYVARIRGGLPQATAAWASVAEPRLHSLSVRDAESYNVRISGGRVAFIRGTARSGFVRSGQLGVVGLTGAERVISKGVEDYVGRGLLDFDGSRVAWTTLTCAGIAIREGSADQSVKPASGSCPLGSLRRATINNRGVRLGLSCRGLAPEGCTAGVVLTASSERFLVARGRLQGGRSRTLRLLSRARAALGQRGALRVAMRASVLDAVGRQQRRRGTLLLRAR